MPLSATRTYNLARGSLTNVQVLTEIGTHLTEHGWTLMAGHPIGADTIVVKNVSGMVVGIKFDGTNLSIRPIKSTDAYVLAANLFLGLSNGLEYATKAFTDQVRIYAGADFIIMGLHIGGTPGESGSLIVLPLNLLDATGSLKGHLAVKDPLMTLAGNALLPGNQNSDGYAFNQVTQTTTNITVPLSGGFFGAILNPDAVNSTIVIPGATIVAYGQQGVPPWNFFRPVQKLLTVFHDNALVGTSISIDGVDDYIYWGKGAAATNVGFFVKNE